MIIASHIVEIFSHYNSNHLSLLLFGSYIANKLSHHFTFVRFASLYISFFSFLLSLTLPVPLLSVYCHLVIFCKYNFVCIKRIMHACSYKVF